MLTCSRWYLELHSGISLKVLNLRALAPGLVSKIVNLAEARSIRKLGTVLSVVRVLYVSAVLSTDL